MRRQAQEGSAAAQRSLGNYYATSEDKDLALSRHWYLQAALQGDPTSMYEIGFTLLLGEGGPADPVGGVEWLEKAAEVETVDNYFEARRLLADIFRTGAWNVPKDEERGRDWAERRLPRH